MATPQTGRAILFAKDLNKLQRFYRDGLGVSELKVDDAAVVLGSEGAELFLHAIPKPLAEHVVLEDPPSPREEMAQKLVFRVDDLDALPASAAAFGGALGPPHRIGDVRISQGIDPEGNVFRVAATPRAHTSPTR